MYVYQDDELLFTSRLGLMFLTGRNSPHKGTACIGSDVLYGLFYYYRIAVAPKVKPREARI